MPSMHTPNQSSKIRKTREREREAWERERERERESKKKKKSKASKEEVPRFNPGKGLKLPITCQEIVLVRRNWKNGMKLVVGKMKIGVMGVDISEWPLECGL